MKKRLFTCLLLVALLVSVLGSAFASDSISGITIYGSKWNEYGGNPSMLNFGYADCAIGEDLYEVNSRNECYTIKDGTTSSNLSSLLDSGMTFYIYAKWHHNKGIPYLNIEAVLIITDPNDRYYVCEQEWEIEDSSRNCNYMWFFDITDKMEEMRDDNGGTLPRGTYEFTMLFNGYTFRATKVKIK